MSTQETTAVHLASSEDVDEFVERLPQMKDERVLITVADDCDAMLTAAEFHRVLTRAREANVTLTISSEDRLRQELARMLGWVVVDTVRGSGSRGNTENLPSRGGDTQDIDGLWTQLHTTADLATYRPPSDKPTNGNGNGNGHSKDVGNGHANNNGNGHSTTNGKSNNGQIGRSVTGTIMVDPAVAEKLIEAKKPSAQSASAASVLIQEDLPEDFEEVVGPERRHRFPRPSKRVAILAAAIGAPIIVLAIVAGILMYVLPTATVTLVPVEQSISADLVYGLATPGKTYDVTIQPVSVSHTTTFDKKIATTGERFVADGTATGNVLLTNSAVQPVTVPAGTAMTGKNGMKYVTQKDVTVPAADPFGSLSFGSATVAVAASAAGTDGNTDAGTIIGQLNSGIFFNNHDAITGGTMKRIAVVSQADIDALKKAAEADLSSRSQSEFAASIAEGMQVVPNSQTTSDPTYQYSLKAGQDGTDVSIHATQTVTAQVFDPGKLNALAKDEAARQLASKVGSNEIILSDTVTIGDPVALPGGTSFSRRASAQTRAVISTDEQARLEQQIIGKDETAAEAIIKSMKDVASYNIVLKPDWLPKRMPQLNSHVKIVVSSSNDASSAP